MRFRADTTIMDEGETKMSHGRNQQQEKAERHQWTPINHRERKHAVKPEIVDNESTPSPSGMAMTLATSGRFPELRSKMIQRLEALYERESTAVDQLLQAKNAQVVLVEQMAAEQADSYEQSVKFFRKTGA